MSKEQNRRDRGDGPPETFNFLGFTHSCGKTRKGHFTVLRQTMRQSWQAKLRALKEELRRRMHTPIREQGAYLRSGLLGHFRYYGVHERPGALRFSPRGGLSVADGTAPLQPGQPHDVAPHDPPHCAMVPAG